MRVPKMSTTIGICHILHAYVYFLYYCTADLKVALPYGHSLSYVVYVMVSHWCRVFDVDLFIYYITPGRQSTIVPLLLFISNTCLFK